MVFQNPPDETLHLMLSSVKTIAVVGLSPHPYRPSNGVARYLQSCGYDIIPVNPSYSMVLGAPSRARLTEVADEADLVNVFRRPDVLPDLVAELLETDIQYVWLQEGVVHEDAAAQAASAGRTVVMDRCILKEHRRLTIPSIVM